MTKLTSKGKYNTSFGTAILVETSEVLRIGDQVIIDGEEYVIKKITLPSRPTNENLITIFI